MTGQGKKVRQGTAIIFEIQGSGRTFRRRKASKQNLLAEGSLEDVRKVLPRRLRHRRSWRGSACTTAFRDFRIGVEPSCKRLQCVRIDFSRMDTINEMFHERLWVLLRWTWRHYTSP